MRSVRWWVRERAASARGQGAATLRQRGAGGGGGGGRGRYSRAIGRRAHAPLYSRPRSDAAEPPRTAAATLSRSPHDGGHHGHPQKRVPFR